MEISDFLVVGSGATGAIAAKTLLERGKQVTVLDAGIWEDKYRDLIPSKDWTTIRQSDKEQHRYFLGDDFEGVVWEESRVGSQLTPPRTYLKRQVEEMMPIVSKSFFPFESLAKGGLGGGWGTGCFAFSEAELVKCGLNPSEINKAYTQVSEWIGISGCNDDAAPYSIGGIGNIQPPLELESSLTAVFEKYKSKRAHFNQAGFHLGRSAVALLSKPLGNRNASSLHDMEFWGDNDKSAYRSWMTIDEMLPNPKFNYLAGWLVISFTEEQDFVAVLARNLNDNSLQTFRTKNLVLSAGVISTARIVQRSKEAFGVKLPIICNPYSYMPTLQWSQLGSVPPQYKSGICQAILFHDPAKSNLDVAQAALFSYRQLLLFKLVKEAPLGFAFGREIMQLLQSAFVIAGIHHPEEAGPDKWISLEKSHDGDVLHGEYQLTKAEEQRVDWREAQFRKALRQLGCLPLSTIRTPHGGSIHYAGTLPFSTTGEANSLSPDGKLTGYKNVWVADGSGFTYLPAKGLTLTLMANAYHVCKSI